MADSETIVVIGDLGQICVGRQIRPTPLASSERNPAAYRNREAIASACGENEVAEAGANNDGLENRRGWVAAGERGAVLCSG